MAYLDALLAFAFTMGALATVVTLIMELLHRFFAIRKGNLIEILKLLDSEVKNSPLGFSPRERWQLLTSILNDPSYPKDQQRLRSPDAAPDLQQAKRPRRWWGGFLVVLRRILGSPMMLTRGNRNAGRTSAFTSWDDLIARLSVFDSDKTMFDKVSLEHVLRRISELPSVQAAGAQADALLRSELDRLGRKFDEFGSTVSAGFKRRAQMYSLVVAVLLALVANIDGWRIFQTYLKDSALTAAVIENGPAFVEADALAQTRLNQMIALQDRVQELDNLVSTGEATQEQQKELVEKSAELEEISSPEALKEAKENAERAVRDLIDLGVPIGDAYWPHNEYAKTAGMNLCMAERQSVESAGGFFDWAGARMGLFFCAAFVEQPVRLWTFLNADHPNGESVLGWLLRVVVTGMLIGLGAPFWFDLARRIAAVRGFFNGVKGGEERLKGKDADGDPQVRKTLVDTILDENRAARAATGAGLVPSDAGLINAPPRSGPRTAPAERRALLEGTTP